MRILVTGSRGVVGTALARRLAESGHEVYGVDLAHSEYSIPFHPHLYGEGRYFRADVSNYREISRVMKVVNPDFVYHAAAEFGRWNGQDYYEKLWLTNAVGTRNILEIQKIRGFRAVYFSSSEVYGDYPECMHEHIADGCSQLNDYAISKWANEQQVLSTPDIEAVRVRLFNSYGPGEDYTPYRSVACRFCYRLLHNQPIEVSRGHSRSHTWLPDAVDALANITRNFRAGRVYNIGTSRSASIEELARIVLRHTGADPGLVKHKPGEAQTTKTKIVDNSFSVEHLGFRDTVTLDEGIRQTVEWMREVYKV